MDRKEKGIDVSHWQGKIDWKEVKKSEIDFALIKIGNANEKGEISLDEEFKRNIEEAKKEKIHIGVYVYSTFIKEEAAQKAAKNLIELVRHYRLTYPIALDFEDKKYQKKTKRENSFLVEKFLKEVEKAHYYVMYYTGFSFLKNYLDADYLKEYDLWIARYNQTLGYEGEYGMWQYSNKGKVKGINGDVDMNNSYKKYAEIIDRNKLYGPDFI